MSQPALTTERPLGECFFLDVGQGTANAVVLPDGRAVIIDVGPRRSWRVLERLLLDRGVNSIECLVISHNDADHIGGLDQCAMTFGDRISKLFLLQDRPIQAGDALDLTLKMADEKIIPEPQRAEAASLEAPTVIWQAEGLSLELWYPSMKEATRAAARSRPNHCCAVALLRAGDGKILFTGDAGDKSWRALLEARPGFVLEVDIVTVPHHGGGDSQLNTLVRSKLAIISVGTHNFHRHPRPEVVRACTSSGANVLCTQITNQCHQLNKLDGGHVVNDVSEHSASLSFVKGKHAEMPPVACAGTVVAIMRRSGIDVPARAAHLAAIQGLDTPLCLARTPV